MTIKKTKIIATIGPSSSESKTLEKMIRAGVNVVRLNFSHGDHNDHGEFLRRARVISEKIKIPIAVIQDIAGPKIRTGEHEGKIYLRRGDFVILTTKKHTENRNDLYVNYKNLPKEVKRGTIILIDDGKKKLRVMSVRGSDIRCKIIVGGEMKGRRGVNVPGVSFKIGSLTKKDKDDVKFGIKNGVDFIALSFVRRAADIKQLRQILKKANADIGIIAKIETHDALGNIDKILKEADGIMIARGDLAVEVPPAEVPMIQKSIIEKCNVAGKPVVVATQMLESMVHAPTPTRAEVSDVANSILDGADAVMLSAETAVGEYPVETVAMMSEIAKKTEIGYPHSLLLEEMSDYTQRSGIVRTVDAITHYVVNTAYDVEADAIVALTESGSTARMVSRYRPIQPIIVMSPNKLALTRLILSFGCYPYAIKPFKYIGEAIERMRKILLDERYVKKGGKFVIAAGVPFGKTGGTNIVMVQRV